MAGLLGLLLVALFGAARADNFVVTSPVYDDHILTDSHPVITWNGTGVGTGTGQGYVRIQLYSGDEWQQTIVDSTPNDGEYNHNVRSWAAVTADGNQFRIKIIELQAPNSYAYSAYFCIAKDKVTCDPTQLTVTAPGCRATLTQGSSNEIDWVVASKPGDPKAKNVKVELYKQSLTWYQNLKAGVFGEGASALKKGHLVETMAATTANDGSLLGFEVASNAEVRNDYYVQIQELDGTKLHTAQSDNFCIKAVTDGALCDAVCKGEEVNIPMPGGYIFLIIMVFVVIFGGAGFGYWWFKKRKRQAGQSGAAGGDKGTEIPTKEPEIASTDEAPAAPVVRER